MTPLIHYSTAISFAGMDFTPGAVTWKKLVATFARRMKHLSIVRSLDSKEGNHERGTYMMHTGYTPNPTVVHPSFGSYCSIELGEKLANFDLPHFISINTPSLGAGFLGMSHSPFMVQNPNAPIANLSPPNGAAR